MHYLRFNQYVTLVGEPINSNQIMNLFRRACSKFRTDLATCFFYVSHECVMDIPRPHLECVCTESNACRYINISFLSQYHNRLFGYIPSMSSLTFILLLFLRCARNETYGLSLFFWLYSVHLGDLEDAIAGSEGGGNEIMGFLKLNAFVCLQNEELKGKAVVGEFFIHSQFDLKCLWEKL